MTTNLPSPTRPAWRGDAAFPFTSRQPAVDGHLIRYVDEGAGPTMVSVHAGPAGSPAWSFVYRDLIVRLRDRFRCVALDLLGTGLSRAAAGHRPSIEAGAGSSVPSRGRSIYARSRWSPTTLAGGRSAARSRPTAPPCPLHSPSTSWRSPDRAWFRAHVCLDRYAFGAAA